MFKIAWSEQEVLFGQYWSINSEMIPETADSGGYAMYGATQLRIPQVRYTQKFGNGFDASLALCSPQNGRWGLNVDATNPIEGETSETPMVEAKVRFEQDLYGKAGWYGKPRAFYVGLGAGYFRSRNQASNFTNTQSATYYNQGVYLSPFPITPGPGGAFEGTPTQDIWHQTSAVTTTNNWGTLGTNNFVNPAAVLAPPAVLPVVPTSTTVTATNTMRANMRYHDHWLFLLENFAPIIPTTSKSLAGTMSLAHQWWIGQGVAAWRLALPGNDRFYNFSGIGAGANNFNYNMSLLKMYGGWLQLQYYWTEPIYTNINFGFSKSFGFNNAQSVPAPGGFFYANPIGYDPINSTWQAGITQWYRPVAAVKFALQYTYQRVNYFQVTTVGSNTASVGHNHNIMANAWYMF
jgi:hypothetical protein